MEGVIDELGSIGSDPSNAFRHLQLLRTGQRRGWPRGRAGWISRYGPTAGESRPVKFGRRSVRWRARRRPAWAQRELDRPSLVEVWEYKDLRSK